MSKKRSLEASKSSDYSSKKSSSYESPSKRRKTSKESSSISSAEKTNKPRIYLKDLDTEKKDNWSEARLKAWENKSRNPNAYYYRFLSDNEECKTGKFTIESGEHKLFMKRLKEKGTNVEWGVFSRKIPGRVGYQCSNYYRQLIDQKWIKDPFYKPNPKKKNKKTFLTKKDYPSHIAKLTKQQLEVFKRYSFQVIEDPSGVWTDLPAYHPKAPQLIKDGKDPFTVDSIRIGVDDMIADVEMSDMSNSDSSDDNESIAKKFKLTKTEKTKKGGIRYTSDSDYNPEKDTKKGSDNSDSASSVSISSSNSDNGSNSSSDDSSEVSITSTDDSDKDEEISNKIKKAILKWRYSKAIKLKRAKFKIFPYKSVEELMKKKPKTLVELRNCYGFGDERIKKYGNSVIKIINKCCNKTKYSKYKKSKSKKNKKKKRKKSKSKSKSKSKKSKSKKSEEEAKSKEKAMLSMAAMHNYQMMYGMNMMYPPYNQFMNNGMNPMMQMHQMGQTPKAPDMTKSSIKSDGTTIGVTPNTPTPQMTMNPYMMNPYMMNGFQANPYTTHLNPMLMKSNPLIPTLPTLKKDSTESEKEDSSKEKEKRKKSKQKLKKDKNKKKIKKSEINCSYFKICKQIVESNFTIPQVYFNSENDVCYCNSCHKTRGDSETYNRGNPSKKYALPLGWSRIGLKINEGFAAIHNIFDKWNVCFHGSDKMGIQAVINSGLSLIKPGDYRLGGVKHGVKDGHIQQPFERINKYTNKKEMFDPNQIYTSPSIKYSGNSIYSKPSYLNHPQLSKTNKLKCKFAFQCRQRPDSYCIGQETIGATRKNKVIDTHFDNNEIEWYTKENLAIVIYGLLVKFEEE